jgi:hypothetical protein
MKSKTILLVLGIFYFLILIYFAYDRTIENAKFCNEYYERYDCTYHNALNKVCYCSDDRLRLTQEMINQKTELENKILNKQDGYIPMNLTILESLVIKK